LVSHRRRLWLRAALAGWAAASAALRAAAATVTPAPAPAPPLAAPPPAPLPGAADDRIQRGRPLAFPRDHGAHNGARIEWWYATGWLQAPKVTGAPEAPLFGFQLTFFRSRTGLAETLAGRFAPRQLLFAHAAVTDVAGRRHRHAERLARWSGDPAWPEAHAQRDDTAITLGRWTLHRQPAANNALGSISASNSSGTGSTGSTGSSSSTSGTSGTGGTGGYYSARLAAPEAGFALDLQLQPTQPLLLQGDAGYSRKGPQPQHASHYYSQPQLAVQARLTLDGQARSLPGRGWLDHEWSDELLAPGAVGWDWIGINLADGGALTAFRLRGADEQVVWAGGSHRPAAGAVRDFTPAEVDFQPQRHWTSPATGARYPVQWRIETPAGHFVLKALLDAQELDSRASTGTVYWEGLAELLDTSGQRRGLGYLEMTGRAQPLRLGL
jgi:predicted secreted hydrolase